MQPAANFDFPMPKDMRMFLVRRCKAPPFFAVITVSVLDKGTMQSEKF